VTVNSELLCRFEAARHRPKSASPDFMLSAHLMRYQAQLIVANQDLA
jgi:hypothetical protein